jgi:hypothetical protein
MDEQEQAERRFEEILAETGARDPRGPYRDLLRELRSRSEERYEEAVRRWREEVIRPVSRGEGQAMELWLTFGATLAEELHSGRTVVVDETGRARPLEPPPSWRSLILHLPEARRVRAIPVCLPPELSPAQRATVDLLVEGRVRLADE